MSTPFVCHFCVTRYCTSDPAFNGSVAGPLSPYYVRLHLSHLVPLFIWFKREIVFYCICFCVPLFGSLLNVTVATFGAIPFASFLLSYGAAKYNPYRNLQR